MLNKVEQNLYS